MFSVLNACSYSIQGVAKKKWPSLKIWLMWYNFFYWIDLNGCEAHSMTLIFVFISKVNFNDPTELIGGR